MVRQAGRNRVRAHNVRVLPPALPYLLIQPRGAVVPPPVASLQHLHRIGRRIDLGLAHQQPKMVRHHHIPGDGEAKLHPHFFHQPHKHVPVLLFPQLRQLLVAMAGKQMEMAFAVDGLTELRHRLQCRGRRQPCQDSPHTCARCARPCSGDSTTQAAISSLHAGRLFATYYVRPGHATFEASACKPRENSDPKALKRQFSQEVVCDFRAFVVVCGEKRRRT